MVCAMPADPGELSRLERYRRTSGNTVFNADRGAAIRELREALRTNRLTICLGAGVSVPNGIPTWATLLSRLSARALSDTDKILFDKIVTTQPDLSPLILARFLKSSFKIESSFFYAIYDSLYSSVDRSNDNKTLDAICRISQFCISHHHQLSIITYNYDDLCDVALENAAPLSSDTVFDDHSFRASTKSVKVIHPHGYLP